MDSTLTAVPSISGNDVILFGLSADPLHFGHINYIRFILNAYPKHVLVIMPCKASPIEKSTSGLSNAELRYTMIDEVLQTYFAQDNIILSDYEIKKDSPSYTYLTINYLKSLNPRSIAVLMGTDNLSQLPRWQKPQYILNNIDKLIVVKRAGNLGGFSQLITDAGRCLHIMSAMDKADCIGDLLLIDHKLYYVNNVALAINIPDFNQEVLSNFLGRGATTFLTTAEVEALLPHAHMYPGFRKIFYEQGKIIEQDGPQLEISSTAVRNIIVNIYKRYATLNLTSPNIAQKFHQELHASLKGMLATCTIDAIFKNYTH